MDSKPLRADLHLHTTASDGALSPREMVAAAARAGMTHIAITDHDTPAGLQEALIAGADMGLVVVSGIELSCGGGEEVHVLGYGLDPDSPALAHFLDTQMQSREIRMLAMLQRLAAIGLPVDEAQVRSEDTGFMGRMNLADAMCRLGYVASTTEAFDRYLGPGKAAFVPRERISVAEGIAALRSFGAAAVLAHPGRLQMDKGTLTALLPEWIDAGLAGIEAYHSSHDSADRRYFDRMARTRGLLVTGGSDSHGRPGGAQIGEHLRNWPRMAEDAAALLASLQANGPHTIPQI